MDANEIVRELRDPDNCDVLDYIDDAADLIESLQAQIEQKTNEAEGMRSNWYKCIESLKESQRRERAAVEMLIKFIKQSDDICDCCKNHIECAGEQCEEFEKGVGGTGNDGTEFPDWHWQCTDFDYGTCAMLANTPCNGCFENDCSGFEWLAYRTKPERSEG
jgi:hypothetical protein